MSKLVCEVFFCAFLKCSHLQQIFYLFVFSCNAKSFAFAFFFSLLSSTVLDVFSPIATLSACEQDRSYDMPYAFKPCPLGINSNGELKRKHLESFSSTTKNISSLPMTTKLGRVVINMSGSHPQGHMTLWLHGLSKRLDEPKTSSLYQSAWGSQT